MSNRRGFIYFAEEIMLSKSKITGKLYEPTNMVHIINPTQSALYYSNGAELIDMFVGKDYKWVWVFDREATKDLYDKYCKWELRR